MTGFRIVHYTERKRLVMICFTEDLQSVIECLESSTKLAELDDPAQLQQFVKIITLAVDKLKSKLLEKAEICQSKEIDIENVSPRNVICIRSDSDVWKAGGDYNHVLEVGEEYAADVFEVHSDYTLLQIRDIETWKVLGKFNSVLFQEK